MRATKEISLNVEISLINEEISHQYSLYMYMYIINDLVTIIILCFIHLTVFKHHHQPILYHIRVKIND